MRGLPPSKKFNLIVVFFCQLRNVSSNTCSKATVPFSREAWMFVVKEGSSLECVFIVCGIPHTIKCNRIFTTRCSNERNRSSSAIIDEVYILQTTYRISTRKRSPSINSITRHILGFYIKKGQVGFEAYLPFLVKQLN
jgi:hypothetical protein